MSVHMSGVYGVERSAASFVVPQLSASVSPAMAWRGLQFHWSNCSLMQCRLLSNMTKWPSLRRSTHGWRNSIRRRVVQRWTLAIIIVIESQNTETCNFNIYSNCYEFYRFFNSLCIQTSDWVSSLATRLPPHSNGFCMSCRLAFDICFVFFALIHCTSSWIMCLFGSQLSPND